MAHDGESAAQRASRELWRLLATDRDHRLRWTRRSSMAPRSTRADADGTLSFRAVARVVAAWLAEHDDETTGPGGPVGEDALRDLVRRALLGTHLQPRTLRWFTEAFDIGHDDSRRLFELLAGGGPGGWPSRWEGVPPTGHRTRSLHELHEVGPDRRPRRHRTVQVIEAEIDGLARYAYRFDTPYAVVSVDEGGVAGPVFEEVPGLWCSTIELATPLRLGATSTLSFTTRFAYDEVPPPEFRRGSRRRVDSVALRVRFDPSALPRQVWFGSWGADGEMHERAAVSLADGVVHRFVERVENEVVGFTWDW